MVAVVTMVAAVTAVAAAGLMSAFFKHLYLLLLH
jgi:hypothetical protein